MGEVPLECGGYSTTATDGLLPPGIRYPDGTRRLRERLGGILPKSAPIRLSAPSPAFAGEGSGTWGCALVLPRSRGNVPEGRMGETLREASGGRPPPSPATFAGNAQT